MKTKTLVLFSILCLTALIILGSCATMNSPDKLTYERFCGTWANKSYEREPGLSSPAYAKYIINPDGTFLGYQNLNETGPTLVAYYTVVKRWSDTEGNSFYHMKNYFPILEGTKYELFKVDKHNATLEVQWSNIDYPSKIDPKDMHSSYLILYRY